MTVPSKLRVLLYDLETAPLLAHVWHPTDDYVTSERLIHDSFLLCWSAKWLGDKTIRSGVVTGAEAVAQDDTRIVSDLAELIREADILVAHNVDQFDVPMFNNRLLALSLEPMGPKRTIDTLRLAKRNFRLAYNKLDYLGEYLGLGRKIKTDFDLWRACYQGDVKALAKMVRYNRQDVVLLEKIYNRLLPYVNNVPRLTDAAYDGQMVCPSCGEDRLIRRGFHHTNVSSFQRYQCGQCTRYCRARTAVKRRFAVAPL